MFPMSPPVPLKHFTVVVIDPPWRYAMGTKGRPQHYPRMSLSEIAALPVGDLLKPEGGRIVLWITAPLLNRIDYLARAWKCRFCSALPWVKVWPSETGAFIYSGSLARGTGYEVQGNAEYAVILKRGKPQSIKGNPFPGVIIAPRREHSRKPPELHEMIEARLSGPFCEVFARAPREGWAVTGNEIQKFQPTAPRDAGAQAAGHAHV